MPDWSFWLIVGVFGVFGVYVAYVAYVAGREVVKVRRVVRRERALTEEGRRSADG